MTLQLKTDQVWREVEQNLFAVLGIVTSSREARTVSIVYFVDNHKFYIGTNKASLPLNAPFREDMQKNQVGSPHPPITLTVSWLEKPATIRLVKGD
jgi:hypothetical protein